MINVLIRKYLNCKKNISIIDLGPGYSNFALEIADLTSASKVALLDYSEDVLNYQIEKFSSFEMNPSIYKSHLNMETINNIKETFDLILCQEILEHLQNPEEILNKLSGLLNIDGQILITVPTKISEKFIKLVNNKYMLNETFGHIQLFSKRRLLDMTNKSNLELEIFKKAQPHYFITHLWIFGSKMEVEGSTGKVLTNDWRNKVANYIFRYVSKLFHKTNIFFWSNIFPRNYFMIVKKGNKL